VPASAVSNKEGGDKESGNPVAKATVKAGDGKPKNGKPKKGKSKSDCAGADSLQAGFGSGCPDNEFKGRAGDDPAARLRKKSDAKVIDPAPLRKSKYDGKRVPEIDRKLEK